MLAVYRVCAYRVCVSDIVQSVDSLFVTSYVANKPFSHLTAFQAEPILRALEKDGDTFDDFEQKVVKACNAYPALDKMIPSMAKRCQEMIKAKGGAIKY